MCALDNIVCHPFLPDKCKLCNFAHSASHLKCRINRSVSFKRFDRLSLFNRFNRDLIFDYNMPSHSQVVYGSNSSSNNPSPEPVPKNLSRRGGQQLSQRSKSFFELYNSQEIGNLKNLIFIITNF